MVKILHAITYPSTPLIEGPVSTPAMKLTLIRSKTERAPNTQVSRSGVAYIIIICQTEMICLLPLKMYILWVTSYYMYTAILHTVTTQYFIYVQGHCNHGYN